MKWHWQYLVPILLTILNVDLILMPMIKGWGMRGWLLFSVVSVLAVIELFCWFFWARWFRQVALVEFAKRAVEKKEVQDAIALGKEIHNDLKRAGIWESIKEKAMDFGFNTFQKATDENSRFVKWLKRIGGFGLWILGISPEPGTRTFGAICCGATGWKTGIFPLAVGNVMRVGYMLGVWHAIFRFFE